MKTIIVATALSLTMLTGAVHAQMNHDHGAMKMGETKAGEAMTMVKINSVDKDNRTVNIDHGEIPALGWPAMTMDLPVTKKVDLETLKEGQEVMATLKKGRDNQFRITKIGH